MPRNQRISDISIPSRKSQSGSILSQAKKPLNFSRNLEASKKKTIKQAPLKKEALPSLKKNKTERLEGGKKKVDISTRKKTTARKKSLKSSLASKSIKKNITNSKATLKSILGSILPKNSKKQNPTTSSILEKTKVGNTANNKEVSKRPAFFSSKTAIKKREPSSNNVVYIRNFLLSGALLFFVFGLATYIFNTATLAVEAHEYAVDLDDYELSATLKGREGLSYKKAIFESSASQEIMATKFETTETRASGFITIYNNEPKEQALREETRFETEEGLVFMLPKGDGLLVPASVAGVPGEKKTMVYAQEPGEKYNKGPFELKIPGWNEIGDSRFETQYAVSSEAFSGGSISSNPVLSAADIESVKTDFLDDVKDALILKAYHETPSEYVFFENQITFSLGDPEFKKISTNNEDKTYVYKLPVNAVVYLFQNEELVGEVLGEQEGDLSGKGLVLLSPQKITSSEVVESEGAIKTKISGNFQAKAVLDEKALKIELKGSRLSKVEEKLELSTGIKKAKVIARPKWRNRLPSRASKIKFELVDKI